jgi:very-short-patch-repair endonuclease
MFWNQVRAGRLNGHKFKRQVPIAPYIVDFLCVTAKLIVELDGSPYATPARRSKDAARDEWLRDQGFRVLRFTNDAVLGNCQSVMDIVLSAVESAPVPSPAPLCGAPSPAKGERDKQIAAPRSI